jgi:hypothetical protein
MSVSRSFAKNSNTSSTNTTMETIQIKIDVNKIEKARLFKGAKGTYLDATLVMRDEPDQYGNIGFVTQQISKEEREAGNKAPIIGNVTKRYVKDAPKPQATAKPTAPSAVDDDLPF